LEVSFKGKVEVSAWYLIVSGCESGVDRDDKGGGWCCFIFVDGKGIYRCAPEVRMQRIWVLTRVLVFAWRMR
jgi:hypothetical protein